MCTKLLLENARDLGEKTKDTTWHNNMYAFVLKYLDIISNYLYRYVFN